MNGSDERDAMLAIDCGTQSLRCMVFDSEGAVLAKEKAEY